MERVKTPRATGNCATASRQVFTRALRTRDAKIGVLQTELRTARKAVAALADLQENHQVLRGRLNELYQTWLTLDKAHRALQRTPAKPDNPIKPEPTVSKPYADVVQQVRLLKSQLSQRSQTVAELRDEVRRLKQAVREAGGATPRSEEFHQPRVFRGPRVTQRQSDALDQILAPAWEREQRKTGVLR